MGTLLSRRRYMGGKALPYDAEIEYLEFTGSQYINTGILPTTTTVVKTRFMNLVATGDLILGTKANNDQRDWRLFNYGNSIYFDAISSRMNGNHIYCNRVYELELGNYYVKDLFSNTTLLSRNEYTSDCDYPILLSQNSKNRFYYVQIYQGNVLVMDLIPVRVGQVGYMYDRVSDELFGNVGTGSINLGQDMSNIALTELEYVEFSTGQYIDTYLYPTTTTTVQSKFYNLATSFRNSVVGTVAGDDSNDWRLQDEGSIMYFDAPKGKRLNKANAMPLNTLYELELGNYYVKDLTTDTVLISGTQYTDNSTYTICLSRGSSNRFYYAKIYDGNNLVMDLVPYKYGDMVFMYDNISHQHFGNVGTGGELIAGPDKT